MPITFPTDTRTTINAIRTAIGRPVYFYEKVEDPCNVCSINPITNESTDPFCSTCSGVGYIVTFSGYTISGHITWAPSETMNWVSGGQLIDGDCRVQIEYTTDNITVIEATDYVIIDGKRFNIKNKMYRGVPELNRVLIDLVQEEE